MLIHSQVCETVASSNLCWFFNENYSLENMLDQNCNTETYGMCHIQINVVQKYLNTFVESIFAATFLCLLRFVLNSLF
jgi:hypothetical protein